MTTVQQEPTAPKFDWMSEYQSVEKMLATGRGHQVGVYVREASKKYSSSRYLHIFLAMVCRCMNAPLEAIKSFEAAIAFPTTEALPGLESPATRVYVETQLGFPAETRSCSLRAKENFQRNLAALREVNPSLAAELAAGADDPDFQYVDVWGRIHLYRNSTKQVLVLVPGFCDQVQSLLHVPTPLGIAEIASGQELLYLLDHQTKDFLLGRKRIIYLFEIRPGQLRAQLHLRDLSSELANREVVAFGGDSVNEQLDAFFTTFRYMPPQVLIGETGPVSEHLKRIMTILDPDEDQKQAEAYYRSDAFLTRQRQIAAGEILPRVLGSTCRWTTFLQYCVRDFLQAFGRLGCETSLLIEENDVQNLTTKLNWKRLNEFRPDFLFAVSHARPSFAVPRELPVISYVQDRCGPLLTISDLSPVVSRSDLFVCMMANFQSYLLSRNVSADQIFVMPIPADETMFYPLDPSDPEAGRFTVDVGFVKHADLHGDKAFEQFINTHLMRIDPPAIKDRFISVFTDLYSSTGRPDGRRHYDDEMQAFVASRLPEGFRSEFNDAIRQLVSTFFISVFANTWRYQFLEALDRAGIEVGLYGKGWDQHPRFRHWAKGSVDRGTQLNKVYNFNKINLNIHPTSTMHQRISECGLAGGFLLDADHPADKDWESVRPYFEPDKEIVLFDTAQDLVDKCRYYLAHPEARAIIASNCHRRALAQRTVTVAAGEILERWRSQLRRILV